MSTHGQDTILFNAIGHTTFILDRDQNIITANQMTSKLAGLSNEEMVGKKCYEIFHGAGSSPDNCPFMKMKKSKQQETEVMLVETLNRKFLVSCTPVFNDSCQLEKIIHIAMDITERKRVEEALQESEEHFRTLFEKATDGIIYLSQNTEIVKINEAFAKMHGYKIEEMKNIKLHELDVENQSKIAPERIRRIMAGENLRFNVKHYHKDGHIIDLEVSAYLLTQKNEKYIVAFHRDFTERKLAEDNLKNLKDKFQGVFDHSPVGIILLNEQGIVYECNEHFAEMFGADRKNYIGMDLQARLPEGPVKQSLVRTLTSYENVKYEGPYTSVITGKKLYISISNMKISPDFIISVIKDITESKLAEEKIKNLLAEKELLLKEVHHRIKNNLNSVVGLMTLQIYYLKEPAAIAALNEARSRVQSIMLLYDKLYRSHDFDSVSISEYLKPLVNEIVELFPNKNIVKIETYIDDFMIGAKKIFPLGIIINELLTNAMKYAFIGKEDGKIIISASLSNNLVTIIIENNGNEIDESIDFATSKGFGLQLVNGLMKQIGGKIKFERNIGSQFILEFTL